MYSKEGFRPKNSVNEDKRPSPEKEPVVLLAWQSELPLVENIP